MKVSVVIPVYNNEATIAATLESVFAQRFEGSFEVIVVNDGSTDGTRAALKTFGDRIRLINQENAGVAAARNAGIAAAAGEYIALLDADDTWTEEKLKKTVPVLEQNPACVAVFSDAVQVDRAGRVVIPYFVPPHQTHSPTLDEMLDQPWPCLPSAIVIRRDTLVAIGGFSEEFKAEHWGGEDDFAFLLMRVRGEIVFVPEKLIRYRTLDFLQRLTKRVRPLEIDRKSRLAMADPEQYFGGKRVFARLMRERFGARGRKRADFAIEETAYEQVVLGMMAMHQGDRGFARRCYLSSIRNRPLKLKTYFRLVWAALPASVAQMLSTMLSSRLRRSLSGPPFLEERAALKVLVVIRSIATKGR
jgi:glycosyltransferase involved in cell wall biosynthesis